MESLKLTAREIMTMTGFKKGKVYDWIKTGKFKTVDSPKGKLILITKEELEEIKNLYNSEQFDNEFETDHEELENIQTVQDSSNNSQTELMREMLETIRYMYDNQLNQTKMLTDSEHRTQQDYFELKAKFETLQNSYKELTSELDKTKKENIELKTQLDKERNKPFWKKKVL